MSEKITVNLFYIGLIATIVSVMLSCIALYGAFRSQVEQDLRSQGQMVAAVYQDSQNLHTLDLMDSEDLGITLMDRNGSVLYQSQDTTAKPDAALLQQALEAGSASTVQSSGSFGIRDYFYACLLGNGQILCVSLSAVGLGQIFSQYFFFLFALVVLLLFLSFGLSILLTRRLIRPIIQLPAQMDDPDLADDPRRVYPELAPFVREIQHQRRTQEAMRQEFTANVTHELKTPLTSISGYAEMISTGLAKPDDVPRFAEKIRIESERMQTLVNDIIELSQLDRDVSPEALEAVDLLLVAEECIDQLSDSAQRNGVSLSLTGDSLVVTGEEKKLWELLYNLIENAIRYNRKGGWVTVEIAPKSKTVAVKDNGIGIPAEHQDRVFERFYRVDKSHSRATGGTGLGLSIVKHIAEQHHAKLTLNSATNVGTEILVTFPTEANLPL